MFLRVLEFGMFAIMFAFMLTQVIAPIWCGTILFPFFRSKAKELEKERARVRDEEVVANLETEIKEIATKTKRTRKVNKEKRI